MSLMRTLAKVAIGVAVAKGAKAVMQNNKSGASGGGLGGLLGGLTGGDNRRSTGADGANARSGGGIEDMLGGLLGGTSGTSQGGLGGLLNRFGKSTGGNSSGGLGGLLGGLAGAAGAGGLLSGLDRKVEAAPDRPEADFGAVLNSQFSASATPPVPPSKDQEALAGLMDFGDDPSGEIRRDLRRQRARKTAFKAERGGPGRGGFRQGSNGRACGCRQAGRADPRRDGTESLCDGLARHRAGYPARSAVSA